MTVEIDLVAWVEDELDRADALAAAAVDRAAALRDLRGVAFEALTDLNVRRLRPDELLDSAPTAEARAERQALLWRATATLPNREDPPC